MEGRENKEEIQKIQVAEIITQKEEIKKEKRENANKGKKKNSNTHNNSYINNNIRDISYH